MDQRGNPGAHFKVSPDEPCPRCAQVPGDTEHGLCEAARATPGGAGCNATGVLPHVRASIIDLAAAAVGYTCLPPLQTVAGERAARCADEVGARRPNDTRMDTLHLCGHP